MTVTATVSPNPGSGPIAFLVDGAVVQNQTVTPSGTATTFKTLNAPGSYEISARCDGNGTYEGSVSNTVRTRCWSRC